MIEPPMAFVTGELLPAWQLDMGVPTLKLYTAFDNDSCGLVINAGRKVEKREG